MYSRIGAMNRAIEKAERHRIAVNLPPEIAAQVKEQVLRLEQHLVRLIEKSAEAKSSGLHGPKGLPVILDKLKLEAADAIVSLNQSPSYNAKIDEMKKMMSQRADRERSRATSGDKQTLQYFRQLEIRQDALRRRNEAIAAHDPNIMTPFVDPLEALYLECCSTWSPEKEEFLSALETPPFPVQILQPDMIAQGNELIERSLSPDVAQGLDYQVAMGKMFGEIYQAACEILETPAKQALIKPDPYRRKLTPDQLEPLGVAE